MTRLIVTPFQPRDAFEIELQNMQQGCLALTMEMADALEKVGPCFTGRDAVTGRVVGCAGLWLRHRGVGESWGLIARGCAGPEMLAITRAVREFLEQRVEHRISGTCLAGWQAGQRWLRLLGFEYEGTMRRYTEDGRDVDLYARAGGKSCSLQHPH